MVGMNGFIRSEEDLDRLLGEVDVPDPSQDPIRIPDVDSAWYQRSKKCPRGCSFRKGWSL